MKHILVLSITLLTVNVMSAQEIIEDAKESTKKENSVEITTNAKKVDGIAAVIGDFIVLNSDIPKERAQITASGGSLDGVTDCGLLGLLLENKLYQHHAIQDSVSVSDIEIKQEVDYTIQSFLQQKPDIDELVKFYKQEDEKGLRDYIFDIIKGNKLSGKMKAKIIDDVEITPEEVRVFFNKIPEDKRPIFGTELKIAQIVSKPKIAEDEKQRVVDRLKQFKADVEESGASFRSKVILYGEDPGMKSNGYLYTLHRERPRMVKEFRQVAFSLQEGEISDPFETEFGFHIIHLQKIRGQEYDISHILLSPKVSNDAIKEAKERLEKVRQQISDGDITFKDAAKEFSDEKETKYDGGQLINPKTQDYNFELTKLDTEKYTQIQKLKNDEISLVLAERDAKGRISFKIIKITDRIEDHQADYAKDYLKIKNLALREKQLQAIEKWQKEKILDTYIKIDKNFKDCKFFGNWLKQ